MGVFFFFPLQASGEKGRPTNPISFKQLLLISPKNLLTKILLKKCFLIHHFSTASLQATKLQKLRTPQL